MFRVFLDFEGFGWFFVFFVVVFFSVCEVFFCLFCFVEFGFLIGICEFFGYFLKFVCFLFRIFEVWDEEFGEVVEG